MLSNNNSKIDLCPIQKSFWESVNTISSESKEAPSLSEFLHTLATVLAVRNIDTWKHSVRVKNYAVMFGLQLQLSQEEIKQLHMGALLHDIGKIGISDDILLKASTLSEDEYNKIKKHPEIGARILEPARALHSIIPIALHHHEHYNGKGYPLGLRGEEISLTTRIISLADAYEAMTSGRLYREAMPPEKAVEEILSELGHQFDPLLGQTFVQMIREEILPETRR